MFACSSTSLLTFTSDQTVPRAVTLPGSLQAKKVFCRYACCYRVQQTGHAHTSVAVFAYLYVSLLMSLSYHALMMSCVVSSFTTVVLADDDSLWVIGVDEINQEVSLEFQPVYEALAFEEESYTEEALDKLPKVPFCATRCVLKKGYHAVSVISACGQRVYDVTLQRGTARLFEVILEPRADANIGGQKKIVDYSAGFRHCLMLTTCSTDNDSDDDYSTPATAAEI